MSSSELPATRRTLTNGGEPNAGGEPRRLSRAELVWEGKYDATGRRVAPSRTALPFQTVETVNESAQDRQKGFQFGAGFREEEWRNRLIWGDKKYVLPSLLPEFAGKVNLIYIDPPFDTGADFSFTATVPDDPSSEESDSFTFTKEPSIIEHKAYRLEPQLLHAGRPLSETPPFPWSRPTLAADKSIFNLVPCDNEYEKEFASFLQKANDVQRFAKLPEQFGFAIEYTDSAGNLRYYEPDFVALTNDGTHYIAETKGLEDVNVANKDRAAQLWCENTTQLTGKPWAYVKVLQTAYKQLQPTLFEDLLVLKQKKLV
jgi:hypothetical protein